MTATAAMRTRLLAALVLAASLIGVAPGASARVPMATPSALRPAVPTVAAALPGPVVEPVPYRVNTYNLQSIGWDQLWTNGGPIQPYMAVGHKDAEGIPMRKWGDGKYYYTPVKIEIQGIEHLDSYVRTGNDPGYIPTLQKLDDKLRQLAVPSGDVPCSCRCRSTSASAT